MMVRKIKKSVKRVINLPDLLAKKYLYRRKIGELNTNRGVVSFTFDDFPVSAATTGRELLEKYGLKGTFFVSYSLMGREEYGKEMFSQENLQLIYDRGHEIGCHTSTHIDCSRETSSKIIEDIQENQFQLKRILKDLKISSFAYPKGRTKLKAKRVISDTYYTSRTTKSGLNYAKTSDANLLKAVALYDNGFDLKYYKSLLDKASRTDGWLILYTHDVDAAPSPFGCTPSQMEAIIDYALKAKISVLPVREAINGKG